MLNKQNKALKSEIHNLKQEMCTMKGKTTKNNKHKVAVSFQCAVCDYKDKYKTDITNDMTVTHKTSNHLKCEECDQIFQNKNKLTVRART